MTIALLATGDEIILGDTQNTNTFHLAHALNSEGLPLGRHLTCGDQENDITECIEFLAKNHNVIILTGGLGPTSDDRTRFALGRFVDKPLADFPEALAHIENRLRHSKLALTEANKQQAKFPVGAELLPNPNGTAMGCFYQHKNIMFFLLPGPPRECLPMFNQYVLPRLRETSHTETELLKWRLFGVAESQIAQQLDDALQSLDCETGYRMDTPYVECKVRCRPELTPAVQAIVEPIAKPHIISSLNQKASEQLCVALAGWRMPVHIIDEVTGGLLQTLIQKPHTHDYVRFNGQQDSPWYFHVTGLREYWSEDPKVGITSLSIQYRHPKGIGEETHELPFRSPLVIHYAAEWLSFRLFHLINELHERVT